MERFTRHRVIKIHDNTAFPDFLHAPDLDRPIRLCFLQNHSGLQVALRYF